MEWQGCPDCGFKNIEYTSDYQLSGQPCRWTCHNCGQKGGSLKDCVRPVGASVNALTGELGNAFTDYLASRGAEVAELLLKPNPFLQVLADKEVTWVKSAKVERRALVPAFASVASLLLTASKPTSPQDQPD